MFSETTPLSSIIDRWPLHNLELSGGKSGIEAAITWQPDKPIYAFANISLEDGAGVIKETGFSDLALSHALNILPTIHSQEPGTIHIGQIKSVVEINNLQTSVRLFPSPYGELPVIHINSLIMETLGGTISGKNLTFDSQRPNLESELILQNIDLYKLARIQRLKGLNVSGRVHGSLPVRFDSSGLHIDNGVFSNEQTKGIIQYPPEDTGGLKDSRLTGYALLASTVFKQTAAPDILFTFVQIQKNIYEIITTIYRFPIPLIQQIIHFPAN